MLKALHDSELLRRCLFTTPLPYTHEMGTICPVWRFFPCFIVFFASKLAIFPLKHSVLGAWKGHFRAEKDKSWIRGSKTPEPPEMPFKTRENVTTPQLATGDTTPKGQMVPISRAHTPLLGLRCAPFFDPGKKWCPLKGVAIANHCGIVNWSRVVDLLSPEDPSLTKKGNQGNPHKLVRISSLVSEEQRPFLTNSWGSGPKSSLIGEEALLPH